MYTFKLSPLSQSEVVSNAFKLYKENALVTMSYSLPASICFFAPSFLTGSNISLMDKWDKNPVIVLFVILGWLLGILFQGALVFKIYCISNHSPCRWLSALYEVLSKLFPLLLLAALYMLMVLSGTMLLIIPGVILSISLVFSFILIIVENYPVLQNLTISHNLVWGHWWYTTSILLYTFLLNICAYLLFFLAVVYIFHDNLSSTLVPILFFIGNIILQTLFIPYLMSVAILLLDDLRKRTPVKINWNQF